MTTLQKFEDCVALREALDWRGKGWQSLTYSRESGEWVAEVHWHDSRHSHRCLYLRTSTPSFDAAVQKLLTEMQHLYLGAVADTGRIVA
jgi:hypothetical protein